MSEVIRTYDTYVVMCETAPGHWHNLDCKSSSVWEYAEENLDCARTTYPDGTYRIAVKRTTYLWPASTTDDCEAVAPGSNPEVRGPEGRSERSPNAT